MTLIDNIIWLYFLNSLCIRTFRASVVDGEGYRWCCTRIYEQYLVFTQLLRHPQPHIFRKIPCSQIDNIIWLYFLNSLCIRTFRASVVDGEGYRWCCTRIYEQYLVFTQLLRHPQPHIFRKIPCSQIPDPPHTAHLLLCLPCGHLALPPHNLHQFLCLP